MAKTIKLEPISQETVVQTNANILSALLDNELDILAWLQRSRDVFYLPRLHQKWDGEPFTDESPRTKDIGSNYDN